METLKTIQTLFKIGRILSKIVFICSLVGACVCAVGLILLPLGDGAVLKLGGVNLYGLIQAGPDEGRFLAAEAMAAGLILCAGEAVLAKFAERYFRNEQTAGTPFTPDGARELMRLGILTIAIPIGCAVASKILTGILEGFADIAAEDAFALTLDTEASVALGIMFIVMSLLCRHGAEMQGAEKAVGPPDSGADEPSAG